MKTRNFRKQTRDDFLARLDRMDPAFTRGPKTNAKSWEVEKSAPGKVKSGPGPLKFALKSFGLGLIALFAASHPGSVQNTIASLGVPQELRFTALALVAAVLTGLVVMLANHAGRACFRKLPGSDRSMAIVTGAFFAVLAFQLPADMWQTGYDYVGGHSSKVYQAALSGETGIAPIDWGSSILVSSLPK